MEEWMCELINEWKNEEKKLEKINKLKDEKISIWMNEGINERMKERKKKECIHKRIKG